MEATVTFEILAMQAMDDSDGDITEASRALVQRLMSDDFLRTEFAEKMVMEGCRAKCHQLRTRKRKELLDVGATEMHPNTAAGILASMAHDRQALMNFPLPRGGTLRNANKKILVEASAMYDRQITTMSIRSRWFMLLADRLSSETATVEQELEEGTLQACYTQAEDLS